MYDSAIECVYICGGNGREALTPEKAGVLNTYAPTDVWRMEPIGGSKIASDLGWPRY
jgi:hypothetical protein